MDIYLEGRERKKHEGMVVCFNVGHNGAGAGAEIFFITCALVHPIHSCVRTGWWLVLIGISTERNKGIDHPMVMAVLFYISRETDLNLDFTCFRGMPLACLLACLFFFAFTGSRYQRYRRIQEESVHLSRLPDKCKLLRALVLL